MKKLWVYIVVALAFLVLALMLVYIFSVKQGQQPPPTTVNTSIQESCTPYDQYVALFVKYEIMEAQYNAQQSNLSQLGEVISRANTAASKLSVVENELKATEGKLARITGRYNELISAGYEVEDLKSYVTTLQGQSDNLSGQLLAINNRQDITVSSNFTAEKQTAFYLVWDKVFATLNKYNIDRYKNWY